MPVTAIVLLLLNWPDIFCIFLLAQRMVFKSMTRLAIVKSDLCTRQAND